MLPGLSFAFRLVYDRETGKPRGYGFCEFAGTIYSFCERNPVPSDVKWSLFHQTIPSKRVVRTIPACHPQTNRNAFVGSTCKKKYPFIKINATSQRTDVHKPSMIATLNKMKYC
jgi:hypothetical protein